MNLREAVGKISMKQSSGSVAELCLIRCLPRREAKKRMEMSKMSIS